MVSNPACTGVLLGDKSTAIQGWLTEHGGCELRLGWRDDHLDFLWENGYTKLRPKDDDALARSREEIIHDLVNQPVRLGMTPAAPRSQD